MDWNGKIGRITKELLVESVPELAARYVHLCGPVPMMEAVRKILVELHVPNDRIKTEAFGRALGKPEPLPSPVPTTVTIPTAEKATTAGLPTATFAVSNKSASLPADKTILDVADEIGVEIDNSCRVGTCGTCRIKLLSGNVTMAIEDGLEPDDKKQGIILACQAKSTSDVTVEA
jgi:ferredoxin